MDISDNDLHARWAAGRELSIAARLLDDEDFQAQLRAAGDNARRRDSVIVGLRKELLYRLLHRELAAVGVEIKPELSRELSVIKPHLFDPSVVEVDWDASTVRSGEFEYQSVRVVLRSEEGERIVESASVSPAGRMGRPSNAPLLRAIIEELKVQERLPKLRKAQVSIVQGVARNRHPDRFPGAGQPSRQKVLEALKAAGIFGV